MGAAALGELRLYHTWTSCARRSTRLQHKLAPARRSRRLGRKGLWEAFSLVSVNGHPCQNWNTEEGIGASDGTSRECVGLVMDHMQAEGEAGTSDRTDNRVEVERQRQFQLVLFAAFL